MARWPSATDAGDDNFGCGLAGNTAIFNVPEGYASGTQLNFSIIDSAGMPNDSQLAQQITVTSGSAPSQTTSGS